MKGLTLYGGTALLMDPKMGTIPHAVIRIENGIIRSIATEEKFTPPKEEGSLDCRGSLVLPGFINGHTHTGMTLLRGIADDLPLMQWLTTRIFPLEGKWGKPDFIRMGTLLASLEMIRSGTTTFNDMYYFEEHAALAAHEAGLRALCGQTVIEMGGVDNPTQDTLRSFEKYFKSLEGFPRVKPAVAPHSVYAVSDKLMKEVIAFARERKVSLHVHVAEVMDEVVECQKRFGMSPVEKMLDLAMFDVPVIAAHATCVTDKDIEILSNHRVGIVTNPESNLKLGAKICPVPEFRAKGVKVCFGTDSAASNNNLDLLSEASTMAKLQCFRKHPGALDVKNVMRMLTIEGAESLGIADEVGSIEVGKRADIIAIDIRGPHAVPLYDPYSHLVYSASGHDVRHTVVDGNILMRDRQILSLDERKVLDEAREFAMRIEPNGLHPLLG